MLQMGIMKGDGRKRDEGYGRLAEHEIRQMEEEGRVEKTRERD